MSYNRGKKVKKNKEKLVLTTRKHYKENADKFKARSVSMIERDYVHLKCADRGEFKLYTYELPKERGSELSDFLNSVLLSINSSTDFNEEGKIGLARQHKEGKTILTIILDKNNTALGIDFNSRSVLNNITSGLIWNRYTKKNKFDKKIVMYFEEFDTAKEWDDNWFNEENAH